jgi:hypothetical protein
MKKHLFLFVLLGILPFGLRAQIYNYAPNSVNIPFLQKKGDASVSLGWGRGNNSFQSLELGAAYSPLPHLAVMANYFGALDKQVRNQSTIGTNGYLVEAAIGAFEARSRRSASLFAGYGIGHLFSNFGSEETSKFDIHRIFIQPGLAYRSKHFRAGLALRISRLMYRNGVISFSIDPQYLSAIQNIEKDGPLFLPELGLSAGMYLKPVTLNLNITSIFPNTDDWNFVRLNTALSVLVEIAPKKKV